MTATLALSSCIDQDNNNEATETTTPTESIDTTDNDQVLRGIAVDGSHRNVYIEVNGDTMDFELPPAMDFTWEIGDSIAIEMAKANDGSDSIASVVNLTAQL